jgi:hydroxymethylpyrimidine pyrophosphatase-like HAD family hydrolase
MLETAGISVAMKNALPEVKAVARFETLTNEEDGVAVFLENYVL